MLEFISLTHSTYFSCEIILCRLGILIASVRIAKGIVPKMKKCYGQGNMGSVRLYFVNQVSFLPDFSETLVVNVHCEVSGVFDDKILFLTVSKTLCHGLCFKESNC
jgi:hypothetical protein